MKELFFRNVRILAITEIILQLKGVIFIPFLTRHFGTINYGVWAQVAVLMGTITPLIILGTDSAIIRFLPGIDKNEKQQGYLSWLIFISGVSLVICAITFLLSDSISVIFFGSAEDYSAYVQLASFVLFFSILLTCLRNWYRILNNAKIYSLIAIAQSVWGIGVLIIILLKNLGVYQLVLYSAIGDMIISLLIISSLLMKFETLKPDFSIIRKLLKFGLPLIPVGYSMWGLNYVDRFFLIKYTDLSTIGIYSLGYALGTILITVFVSPIWAMFPNSAAELYNQNDLDGIRELFNQSVEMILIFILPVIAVFFALGKPILSLFVTSDFLPAAALVSLVTIGYLFHMIASYYDVALGLFNKQYLATVSIGIALLSNVILNILLIPKYGLIGAAIATSLSFCVQFLCSYLFSKRFNLYELKITPIIKLITISFLVGYFINIVYSFINYNSLLSLIGTVVLGSVLYLVLIILFKIITVARFKNALSLIISR